MRCLTLPFAAVVLAIVASACHGGVKEPRAGGEVLRLRDVFDLEYATDPRISPAGRRVVYVRNLMDVMTDRRRSHLWMINVDGSDHQPLTEGTGSEWLPRWSPDGKRVVFLSKKAAAGKSASGKSNVGSPNRVQLRCLWLESGKSATLAELDSEPPGLAFSPGGESIAFSMFAPRPREPFVELPPKPEGAQWADPPKMIRDVLYRADGQGYLKHGFHHLFVVPAEGGAPRQLTRGPFHHRETPCWSADGKSLVFSANRDPRWEHQPRNSEVYRLTLADGKIKPLTDRDGPDAFPVVSPDGNRIAWVGYDDRRLGYQVTRMYVMNRDGSGRRLLTEQLDRDVKAPIWARDGKSVYFQFDDQGTTKLGRVALEGKVSTLAENVGGATIGRPYSSGSFSLSRDGKLAFTQTRPEHPADVAVLAPGEKEPLRLTRLNRDLLGHKRLGATEELWFKSSHDGREIHGWVVKPPGFDPRRKYPLILEIHGGPFANYGPRFSAEVQLYAAAGYVVLYLNPRGSTGYGQEFGNLIHHDYPGHDYDDLMSGVDAVIRRGYIDEKNLFVTGGSGGGVLTSWIVGKTNRFRAAVAAKPVIDWYSFVLTADMYPFFNQYWFPDYPWKQPREYRRRSPISLVGNVTTPTMLLTGEADHRTPIAQSEEFYQALKLRGVDTALVRVPGAAHAIAKRPSHLIAKVAYVLKWFEEHAAAR